LFQYLLEIKTETSEFFSGNSPLAGHRVDVGITYVLCNTKTEHRVDV